MEDAPSDAGIVMQSLKKNDHAKDEAMMIHEKPCTSPCMGFSYS